MASDLSLSESSKTPMALRTKSLNLCTPATLAQSETYSTIANFNFLNNKSRLSKELNPSISTDVDALLTRKIDLDYIPGLDGDDLKVILPGKIKKKTKLIC